VSDEHDHSQAADCREAIHTIYQFLDGELTPELREQIRRHLDDCSPCLEAYDFEAELRMVIARKCRESVPETLRLRIHEVLIREAQQFPGTGGGTSFPGIPSL